MTPQIPEPAWRVEQRQRRRKQRRDGIAAGLADAAQEQALERAGLADWEDS